MIPNTYKSGKKCFLNICCQAWPPPPVFVQMGLWIQDKTFHFLVLYFILLELVHCLRQSKSVEFFILQHMLHDSHTWIKTQNLDVPAPRTPLHNYSQPITNKLVLHLLSHEINGRTVICHVANCLGKAWMFFVFHISQIHWSISTLSEGNEACLQAIYTCSVDSVAGQWTAMCRMHLLFLWPLSEHLWNLGYRT